MFGKLIVYFLVGVFGWFLRGIDLFDSDFCRKIDDAVSELLKIESLAIEIWSDVGIIDIDDSKVESIQELQISFLKRNQARFFEIEGRIHRLSSLVDKARTNNDKFSIYKIDANISALRACCTEYTLTSASNPGDIFLDRIKEVIACCTRTLVCLKEIKYDLSYRSQIWAHLSKFLCKARIYFRRQSRNIRKSARLWFRTNFKNH